jgi:hypothetical protein
LFLQINYLHICIEEADSFNHEWVSRTRRVGNTIENSNSTTAATNSRHRPEPRQLALPSTTDSSARLVTSHLNYPIIWLMHKFLYKFHHLYIGNGFSNLSMNDIFLYMLM